MKQNTINQGNCLEGLKTLPDSSVHTCVTSPPYYNLRVYGVDGQIGLEHTPEEYIQKLVGVFREVRRVLRDDGTLWVNISDSYNGSGKAEGDKSLSSYKQATNRNSHETRPTRIKGYKPKDLIGIPWMLAFALRSDGWFWRDVIIWHKPNPMPESVKDRCTKSHEYILMFSKSAKYYFDAEAIKTDTKNPFDDQDRILNRQKETHKNVPSKLINGFRIRNEHSDDSALYMKANKRSVWTVTTRPFKEAHFATYPPELIVDCIKAGSPEGGVVLDPFGGSGTTAVVSGKLNRNWILWELNPAYVKIIRRRIRQELGLFAGMSY